jgi:uncharacterized membrane protein YphA (DoxX/SURF4 family)
LRRFNGKSSKYTEYAQLYLRLAIGISFLVFGLDRLGAWGPHGAPGVSWGDWSHFMEYATQVMGFLPPWLAQPFAVVATAGEIVFGVLLIVGKWTRIAAAGSSILTALFALSMAISFGIISPLSYSVFAVSAGSLLLATLPAYRWSLDDRKEQRRALI